jgi:hypothetical protein
LAHLPLDVLTLNPSMKEVPRNECPNTNENNDSENNWQPPAPAPERCRCSTSITCYRFYVRIAGIAFHGILASRFPARLIIPTGQANVLSQTSAPRQIREPRRNSNSQQHGGRSEEPVPLFHPAPVSFVRFFEVERKLTPHLINVGGLLRFNVA